MAHEVYTARNDDRGRQWKAGVHKPAPVVDPEVAHQRHLREKRNHDLTVELSLAAIIAERRGRLIPRRPWQAVT